MNCKRNHDLLLQLWHTTKTLNLLQLCHTVETVICYCTYCCGIQFFCVRCDDRAKSSGRWLLGSPPSTVVRQLAPRAWYPLQCLMAKTVSVLSPGVGRSEECAQEFAPQSHIHSGLNQQDLVSLDVFLAHSDQHADGRLWFGSCRQGC